MWLLQFCTLYHFSESLECIQGAFNSYNHKICDMTTWLIRCLNFIPNRDSDPVHLFQLFKHTNIKGHKHKSYISYKLTLFSAKIWGGSTIQWRANQAMLWYGICKYPKNYKKFQFWLFPWLEDCECPRDYRDLAIPEMTWELPVSKDIRTSFFHGHC